jgi:hypothetical protein
MKKMIAASACALAMAGVGAAVLAPQANASVGPDGQYLRCLAQGWGYPSNNSSASLSWGYRIVNAIQMGVTPLDERDYVYTHSDIDSLAGANVMVNCATSAYLGFGPPLTV